MSHFSPYLSFLSISGLLYFGHPAGSVRQEFALSSDAGTDKPKSPIFQEISPVKFCNGKCGMNFKAKIIQGFFQAKQAMILSYKILMGYSHKPDFWK